jgi:hypothetical protein
MIAKLETDSINKEFNSIIDSFINPENIKELIINRESKEALAPLIAAKLKINTADPEQAKILDSVTDYVSKMSESDIAGLKRFLKSMQNNYLKNSHPLREETNRRVHEEMVLIIFFFIVIAVMIYMFASKMGNYCGFMKHLAIELLVIFGCVGAIEFWFFTNVAIKYVPVKPDVIVGTFKKTLTDKLNK